MMCKPTHWKGSSLLQYHCSSILLYILVLCYTIHILVLCHIYWYCARLAILWHNGKITERVARCIWYNYTEEMMCKPTHWEGSRLLQYHCSSILLHRLVLCYICSKITERVVHSFYATTSVVPCYTYWYYGRVILISMNFRISNFACSHVDPIASLVSEQFFDASLPCW